MPSMQCFAQSGGIALCSGNPFSGTGFPVGGIQLKLDRSAPSTIGIGLTPIPGLSGVTSGASVTFNSGGSLSSGGFSDAMSMAAGDAYFIPKTRLTSGIQSILVNVPAAASGGILYWEYF